MNGLPFDISLGLVGAYGALPASRPRRSSDRVIAVPFEFTIEPQQLAELRIAVFAHIFYPELSAEIANALVNIPIRFDLFVSTDSEEKKAEIDRQLQFFGPGRCVIRVFPNRGRDIAPFLVGFRDEIGRYDVIGHFHSKNSRHNDILFGWREYSFRQLFGSPTVVGSVLYALQSGHVDFLFPDHFGSVIQSLNYGFDYEHMKRLLARIGVSFSKDVLLEFPSGSMFWARSRALAPLLELNLQFEDFPPEQGQIDGTLADAIERCFLFLVEQAGGRWAKIVQPDDCADKDRLIPVCSSPDIGVAVTRTSRRLLGNRASTNLEPRSNPEIPAVGFRGEKSLRPRFTLLIPTLKPGKIFGGVTSALRLFMQIAANLPGTVDARVVSVTENVDIDCLTTVDGYTLVSLAAENTELPRTIVDASGMRAEQLPIREKEVFLATAWWTAHWGFEMLNMQKSLYGSAAPLYYFIQDHEPEFYGWSTRYALARATYMHRDETKAIINSEELYNFFAKAYGLTGAYYVPYAVNERLRGSFRAVPKERIILVYGRPGTLRNCFEILVDGLCLWQQADPITARSWRIVAVGETFEPWLAQHVSNFEILGKMALSDYADMLCRAAVGISLMLSPHPSHPPLEMAEAGAITLTNKYEGKDLSLRTDNIVSIEVLTPHSLASEIARAVSEAELRIGQPARFVPIAPIPCKGTVLSATVVARSMMTDW
jgi:Rhamnan synthesis protein F